MNSLNYKLIFALVIGILSVLILVPALTNLLMFIKPFKWLAPYGIEENNVWISYIATYFGAVFGGIISGLWTYFGVRLTISEQRKKDKTDLNHQHRAILEIQEISQAALNLGNVPNRNGRLIVTEHYQDAIEHEYDSLNFLHFHNSGPGKIFNCNINISVKYAGTSDTYTIEVNVPVIFEKENVYVCYDRFFDENRTSLHGRRYRLNHFLIEYSTYTKETIQIERIVENIMDNRASIDSYRIRTQNETEFIPLFDIEGSTNNWIFINSNS